LKHELPALQLATWGKIASARNWDEAKRRAIISEFAVTIEDDALIGFAVAIDQAAWLSIGPKHRRPFGTIEAFCFLRLMRLVFDRIEAADCPDTISVDFAIEPHAFERRSKAVQRLLKADSRASNRVESIQFVDADRRGRLQAVRLLTSMIMRSQIAREQQSLGWLNRLTELPEPQAGHTFEYWDKSFTGKNFSRLEWLTAKN
jgi:hypothetical protein